MPLATSAQAKSFCKRAPFGFRAVAGALVADDAKQAIVVRIVSLTAKKNVPTGIRLHPQRRGLSLPQSSTWCASSVEKRGPFRRRICVIMARWWATPTARPRRASGPSFAREYSLIKTSYRFLMLVIKCEHTALPCTPTIRDQAFNE